MGCVSGKKEMDQLANIPKDNTPIKVDVAYCGA